MVCGAASSGQYSWALEDILKAATCMLLAGPLMTGYTQTLNDFYDRDLDAINEPYRPIPSGGNLSSPSCYPDFAAAVCQLGTCVCT